MLNLLQLIIYINFLEYVLLFLYKTIHNNYLNKEGIDNVLKYKDLVILPVHLSAFLVIITGFIAVKGFNNVNKLFKYSFFSG